MSIIDHLYHFQVHTRKTILPHVYSVNNKVLKNGTFQQKEMFIDKTLTTMNFFDKHCYIIAAISYVCCYIVLIKCFTDFFKNPHIVNTTTRVNSFTVFLRPFTSDRI